MHPAAAGGAVAAAVAAAYCTLSRLCRPGPAADPGDSEEESFTRAQREAPGGRERDGAALRSLFGPALVARPGAPGVDPAEAMGGAAVAGVVFIADSDTLSCRVAYLADKVARLLRGSMCVVLAYSGAPGTEVIAAANLPPGFLSIPTAEARAACAARCGSSAPPQLAIVDAHTAEIICRADEGRECLEKYGPTAFPFTPAGRAEAAASLQQTKDSRRGALSGLGPLGDLILPGPSAELLPTGRVSAAELAARHEFVALFIGAPRDSDSRAVGARLAQARDALPPGTLSCILLPAHHARRFYRMPHDQAVMEDQMFQSLLRMPMLDMSSDRALPVMEQLSGCVVDITPPCVIVTRGGREWVAADASGQIIDTGVAGFPWTPEAVQDAREKQQRVKAEATQRLAAEGLPAFGPQVAEAGRSAPRLVLFVAEPDDDLSRRVGLRLQQVRRELGADQFAVCCIPAWLPTPGSVGLTGQGAIVAQQGRGAEAAALAAFAGELGFACCAAPCAALQGMLNALLGDNVRPPHVALFGEGPDSGGLALLVDDACAELMGAGASGFPWTKEAMDAYGERCRARSDRVVEGLVGWAILAPGAELPELRPTPGAAPQKGGEGECEGGICPLPSSGPEAAPAAPAQFAVMLRETGQPATAAALRSARAVLLYFGASWCGPCQDVQPQVAEQVSQLRREHGDGAIFPIYVSLDRTPAEYAKSVHSLHPGWGAVRWEGPLRALLADAFAPGGIPHAALLRGDGTLVAKDALMAVVRRPDLFPWH